MSTYYGEKSCTAKKNDGNPCSNKAYYEPRLCGVHCRKDRVKLSKNPNASKIKNKLLEDHKKSCEDAAEENRSLNKRGSVMVSKMRMMKPVIPVEGYINIFPNYKHGNRKDAYFDCSALSPFNLGPVKHGEPNYPPAKNIENYHQFSKVFPSEINEKGKISKKFFKMREEAFLSEQGQRHKFKGVGNIPVFSVHYDSEGNMDKYSYVASRQFYCRAYERLAKKTDEFKRLKELLDDGYNINIIGYDGFDISNEEENLVKLLKKHYLSDKIRWGHEACLFTLLTVKKKHYPWPSERTIGDMN